MRLAVSCNFCQADTEHAVALPDGWVSHDHDIEDALCPDHAIIEGFRDAQCPGCVEGWGDCSLFKAFAYSSHRTIGESEFAAIEAGRCPYRTNGTLIMRAGSRDIERLDLSERAPDDAGVALVGAIKDYMERYPVEH